jgi:hypothetical protein
MKEVFAYFTELKKSKKKKHKDMAKGIMKIDPELVNKFLALYLERCKFRHAFAFL